MTNAPAFTVRLDDDASIGLQVAGRMTSPVAVEYATAFTDPVRAARACDLANLRAFPGVRWSVVVEA